MYWLFWRKKAKIKIRLGKNKKKDRITRIKYRPPTEEEKENWTTLTTDKYITTHASQETESESSQIPPSKLT